jgi:hypothetical protein
VPSSEPNGGSSPSDQASLLARRPPLVPPGHANRSECSRRRPKSGRPRCQDVPSHNDLLFVPFVTRGDLMVHPRRDRHRRREERRGGRRLLRSTVGPGRLVLQRSGGCPARKAKPVDAAREALGGDVLELADDAARSSPCMRASRTRFASRRMRCVNRSGAPVRAWNSNERGQPLRSRVVLLTKGQSS